MKSVAFWIVGLCSSETAQHVVILGSKSRPNEKPSEACGKVSLGKLSKTEDEDDMILHNPGFLRTECLFYPECLTFHYRCNEYF
jgi:hypothetical protein